LRYNIELEEYIPMPMLCLDVHVGRLAVVIVFELKIDMEFVKLRIVSGETMSMRKSPLLIE
jgi:hypothetical protein